MDKQKLYDQIASRKTKPKDFQPYAGDNGRVNKCVQLFRSGKLRSGGALLDVGGGIGDLGYAVRDLFSERIIQDISNTNLKAAEAKGNVVVTGDVDQVGIWWHLEPITTVTALDFIEHIIDPENFARECFRVLKSSGQVFINTPNIQFWRHIDKLIFSGQFPHTSGDREVYHGGHLAFFTYADLCEIFDDAGFKNFEQVKDEEGYEQPSSMYSELRQPKTQQQYVDFCMRFGNPNLLFIAEKP